MTAYAGGEGKAMRDCPNVGAHQPISGSYGQLFERFVHSLQQGFINPVGKRFFYHLPVRTFHDV
jgi:hypothetical protein